MLDIRDWAGIFSGWSTLLMAIGIDPFVEDQLLEGLWENFFCAGDWVWLQNPSFFLERACVTGLEAANRVLSLSGKETFEVQPYLLPEPLTAH